MAQSRSALLIPFIVMLLPASAEGPEPSEENDHTNCSINAERSKIMNAGS
jgi:hypothetical protein